MSADSVIENGERYEFFAGPFHSLTDAYDYIEAMIEYGEIAENTTVVDHKTVTVYKLAPPLAPE